MKFGLTKTKSTRVYVDPDEVKYRMFLVGCIIGLLLAILIMCKSINNQNDRNSKQPYFDQHPTYFCLINTIDGEYGYDEVIKIHNG